MFKKFQEIAEKYPTKISLVCFDKTFSYNELLNKINDFSLFFSDKNKACIIYLPKNEFSIIFQLALRKSGNIFTLIDINTPINRVNEIIIQLKPKWIISLENFEHIGFEKNIKENEFSIYECKEHKNYAKNVSHIFFSSGSTGLPKGILLEEQSLIEVVLEQAEIIEMKPGKKFAWLLSPSFDASLSDIYLTLFSGGELHICDFAQNKIKTMINYFKKNEITHSDISPSILPFLKIDELFLESIIFGGEIGNENVIKKFSKKINMFNAYGPTETTICSSFKKVDDNWTANNIGKPLNNVNFIINNEELYISGSHLCIGYINEELNKTKFCELNGVRFYKTGDLVYQQNQEFFYKGRTDRQFKYNGILISPEEIENLAKKAGCNEAKCEKREKIIFYYQGDIEEKNLRNYLELNLNKNMVPNIIIKVEHFKKNINGKTIL